MAGLHRFLEPCRLRALEEFPAVKQRFHKGLPPQQSLFVVTRLRDSQARMEQVFVAVDSLRTDRIVGRIWSDIHSVSGYQMRQPIEFAESEIVDWMISKPDGSEEGNRMGKLIDELQLKGSLPPDACAR